MAELHLDQRQPSTGIGQFLAYNSQVVVNALIELGVRSTAGGLDAEMGLKQ
jgi:hypothetical protein